MKENVIVGAGVIKQIKGESGVVYENKVVPDPRLGQRDAIVPQNDSVTLQGE